MPLVSADILRLQRTVFEAEKRLAWLFPSYLWGDPDDFVAAMTDPDGCTLVCSNPRRVASVELGVKASIKFFGQPEPGDTWLVNDPFSGGTHLQDHSVQQPLFLDGRLVGFAVHGAHFPDVGGKLFGGYFPQATEIWQEGIRTPPIRLRHKGGVRADAVDFLSANTRSPEIGRASIDKLLRDVDSFSLELLEALDACPDWPGNVAATTEEAMRGFIGSLPRGKKHTSSLALAHSCVGRESVVEVAVSCEDAQLVIDFSGSSSQGDGNQNATIATTLNAVCEVLGLFLDVRFPNSALLRDVLVVAPQRSITNAQWPVAVGWSVYSPAAEIMVTVAQALSALSGRDISLTPPRPPETIFRIPGCGAGDCPFDQAAGVGFVYGKARSVSL